MGFGLTDEDPEEKSYRSIAQITKLFGGLGVEVLGAGKK